MQIKHITYTGNAADARGITGVGFQPDFVYTKKEIGGFGDEGVMRTATMAGDNAKEVGAGAGLEADLIESLDADGFTIGTDSRVNDDTFVYHALCIKAATEDFFEGSYTGNGVDDRSISGFGFQPDIAIVLPDTTNSVSAKTSGFPAAITVLFTGAGGADRIQAFEADGIQVGTDGDVNTDTITYYVVGIKETATHVHIVGYTGNGVDDRDITGFDFDPSTFYVWRTAGFLGDIKYYHPSTLAGDLSATHDNNPAIANVIQDLITDGVELGTDLGANFNTIDYDGFGLLDGDSQAEEEGGEFQSVLIDSMDRRVIMVAT